MTTSPIRVMLVDDHTMVRRGLATFMQIFDDLELVGEAADGHEAVTVCAQTQPDVILMDMIMSHGDGITATRVIRERFPQVQVIALTSFKEGDLVQKALQAGALGYLLKDISADALAQAIRAAYLGQPTVAAEVTAGLIKAATRLPEVTYNLTEREHAVLKLLVAGLNNREIAEKLFVSPSTIKSHVSHILAKLDVSSRTEAATLAIRHELVN